MRTIRLKVKPGSREEELSELDDGSWLARVKAPPVDGKANAALIANHAREMVERCERPILLENITSHVRLEGDLSEPDFLNAICDRADCGLLFDVTNLFINSRNHGFNPLQWLDGLDTRRIKQLHIAGYARDEGGGRFHDDHGQAIQPELLDLAHEVIARAQVESVILERDENIPSTAAMEAEVAKLRTLATKISMPVTQPIV